MCIVGYLLSLLGLLFLITGADIWVDSGDISNEAKAKRTGRILRLVALPLIPLGMYFFLTARPDLDAPIEIIMLLGSLLVAFVGLLALVTGWNVFALMGDSNPLKNPTPGSVRRFGLMTLLVAALVVLRAKMYGLF